MTNKRFTDLAKEVGITPGQLRALLKTLNHEARKERLKHASRTSLSDPRRLETKRLWRERRRLMEAA